MIKIFLESYVFLTRKILLEDDDEQSEIEKKDPEQTNFDEISEGPIDLSKRNGQERQILDNQSDKIISDGQYNRKRRLRKRNSDSLENSKGLMNCPLLLLKGNFLSSVLIQKYETITSASLNAKRRRTESELPNSHEKYGNRTFSMFTPAEQEELRHKASYIYNGATFKRFVYLSFNI